MEDSSRDGIRASLPGASAVLKAECEVLHYVNWIERRKAGCVVLRPGVNIVRASIALVLS